ncbi:lipocalin-like domain-containing protein, partial [Shewanella sp.]
GLFPQDHGPHLEQGIEWWYITANLTADTGETFGAQWTLFRTQVPLPVKSTWWDNQLYFAHFALQHQQSHVAFERFARAGQARISASPFFAQLDDWSLKSTQQRFLPLQMQAKQDDYAIDVSLSNSPLTLHGENGYSQKTSSGHASYYFSYPFLETSGTVTFNGKQYKVSGNAWYDREWSASLLDKSQLGWDWFSLVSDENGKEGLMLFCIRDAQHRYDYCSGTRIAENGQATQISREDINLQTLEHITIEGTKYPSKWQIELPDSAPVLIETITKNSLNKLSIQYWEGRVRATGGFNGIGYAELAGY